MILMGFNVDAVPTADVMELAAKLLEIDEGTIRKLVATAGVSFVPSDNNAVIASLLRDRAAKVRALEAMIAKTELDS